MKSTSYKLTPTSYSVIDLGREECLSEKQEKHMTRQLPQNAVEMRQNLATATLFHTNQNIVSHCLKYVYIYICVYMYIMKVVS